MDRLLSRLSPRLRNLGMVLLVALVAGGLYLVQRAQAPSAGTSSATIAVRDLPSQARTTLRLIDSGGPFPYPRDDGVVFGNREGLLPAEPSGYYHEYTVPTPGSPDRGARRIVAGEHGERFWTADHYASFRRITGLP